MYAYLKLFPRASAVASLAEVGYVYSTLTDDQLQEMLQQYPSLPDHLHAALKTFYNDDPVLTRLSYEWVEAGAGDVDALLRAVEAHTQVATYKPLTELLGTVLKNIHDRQELPPMLQNALPVSLALILLSVSRALPVPLDVTKLLLKAVAALLRKPGNEPLVPVFECLVQIVANSAVPDISETIDFFVACSLALLGPVAACARRFLEEAAQRDPQGVGAVVSASLRKRAPSLLQAKFAQTFEVQGGLFASTQKALLEPCTAGLLAAPIPARSLANTPVLGSQALERLFFLLGGRQLLEDEEDEQPSPEKKSSSAKPTDMDQLLEDYVTDDYKKDYLKTIARLRKNLDRQWLAEPMAEWLGTLEKTSQGYANPLDVLRAIGITNRICAAITADRSVVRRIYLLLVDCVKQLRELGQLSDRKVINLIERVFRDFCGYDATVALPVEQILEFFLCVDNLQLKAAVLNACALSLWNERQNATELRSQLDAKFEAKFAELIHSCRAAIGQTAQANVLSGLTEDRSIKGARRCVCALMSLMGSEYVFQDRFVPWRVVGADLAKVSDFVMDTGFWLLECLANEHDFSEGFLDIKTVARVLMPVTEWCRCQLAQAGGQAPLVKFYSHVSLSVRLAYSPFLTRINDVPGCVEFVKAVLKEDMSGAETAAVASALRLMFRSSPDDQVYSLWEPCFDWGQMILQNTDSASDSEMEAAVRDLLTVLCSTIPSTHIEALVAVLLKAAHRSAEDPTRDTHYVYVELMAILIQQNAARMPPALLTQLTPFVVTTLAGWMEKTNVAIATKRAWHHVLTRLLESMSAVREGSDQPFECFLPILETVYRLREKTEVTLWKSRMQLLEAVMREIDRCWSVLASPITVQFVIQCPLFEAAWKSSSLTSVTRRRARRVLDKVAAVLSKGCDSQAIVDFLMVGMATSESKSLQRGFVTAAEHLCEHSPAIAGTQRQQVEHVIGMVKPLCFNLEKKSTRSSVLGSRATKSTRFTYRSSRSVKSRFKVH